MIRWVENLTNSNEWLKQTKELFNDNDIDRILASFQKDYFDENWSLTKDWFDILTHLRNIWNNEQVYKQVSNEFKASIRFNLEKYRKTPQKLENEKQRELINRWIEAEYSYIDQNRFWKNEQPKVNNALGLDSLNTFSKMQLVDLYELCEWDDLRKKEFVLALMKNDENIYKNEYLALLANDIKAQIPYFKQNTYASNGETPYTKIDENTFFMSIWNKLSEIWKDIKWFLETWVWTLSNVWDIIKKSFQNWEKKQQELIKDFDKKYNVLSEWLKTAEDSKTWFSWMLIQEKANKDNISLLIRWSDDWKDWSKNNIEIATKKKLPPQVWSVIRFIEEAKEKWIIKQWQKINIVGHSLGWWLAQIASMMYKNDVAKTYTFNAPWIAWIETNIDDKDKQTQDKVKDYKRQLEVYKQRKEANPNYEEDFILNVRNNDLVWNFDDKNHIWIRSWQIDWFSHFLDSLNASIQEMSIEEFGEKFKEWLKKIQNNT